MWRTQEGDRVLAGAEAAFFRAALDSLVFDLDLAEDAGDPHGVGVEVFDRLSLPEKLAVLEQVGRGLLLRSVPCPRHTAIGEGAIAAVYYHALGEVEVEMDEPRRAFRRLVRAACAEAGQAEGLPRVGSRDVSAWAEAVEGLMDRVLWDRDWEREPTSPDADPDAARMVRRLMTIDDDYYVVVPPDPAPDRLRRVRASLRRLVRGRGQSRPDAG